MSVTYGTPLVTEALVDLEIGTSSHADVLIALGQPRGEGTLHINQLAEPREILFYEFLKSDGKNVELELLVVFLHDQNYDGHLWFGSSERFQKEGSLLATEKVSSGHFPSVDALESTFVRGKTAKTEIVEELGTPSGVGAAILPPEYREQDVMFYQEMEVGDMENVEGEIVMNMRQNVLIVLVSGDVFDGFMWYSNLGIVEGKIN
jgi:hypothetical protein